MGRAEAKKAMDASKKGGVTKSVQQDVKVNLPYCISTSAETHLYMKSLSDTLESSFKRAERDNDLIYHRVVPSASSVPPISDIKDVVYSIIPPGIEDPKTLIGEGAAIFGELSGWGVRVAVGKGYSRLRRYSF